MLSNGLRSVVHFRRLHFRHLAVGIVSVVFQVQLLASANAADWYTGAAPAKPSTDWIVSVDASATATSTGSDFASVAGTIATSGTLNDTGPRLRIEGLAGTYKFDSETGDQIKGEQGGGALLGGYQWKTQSYSLAAFGGFDIRNSQFSAAPGVTLPTSGLREGAKGVLEYYATPSDHSMVFAYGSYSTIYNAYYARLKYGFAPAGQVYIGPEVAALGDDLYRQWRIGGHITGFQFGAMQFGVSAGYQVDKTGKGGAYGSLDARAVY